jgi:class 3 adenylate cyclase
MTKAKLANEKTAMDMINKREGVMETEMLKSTLNKIGGLLAIGFGEAGSKIVAKNMQKGDEVNPMLPG